MSDREVQQALDVFEAWVSDPAWEPDAEALATWEAGFKAVVATAERGAGWADLIERAHALGAQMEQRTEPYALQLAELHKALQAQELGRRALRGYAKDLA
jgi:hypothetical protein